MERSPSHTATDICQLVNSKLY